MPASHAISEHTPPCVPFPVHALPRSLLALLGRWGFREGLQLLLDRFDRETRLLDCIAHLGAAQMAALNMMPRSSTLLALLTLHALRALRAHLLLLGRLRLLIEVIEKIATELARVGRALLRALDQLLQHPHELLHRLWRPGCTGRGQSDSRQCKRSRG